MNSASLLLSDDLCARRAWYSLRWRAPFLTPKQILIEAVEHGLTSNSDDPGEAAEAHALDLAVEPGIDTPETDLLGLSQHIATFANFLTWVLRGPAPWKRPESHWWTSGAFLDPTETHLRRVVLLDRWDSWAQLALERSWDVAGECAAYGVGMDCLIIEIGSLRSGRWANPFTRGYRHPVSKTLRFQKRDGEDFGSTWNRVDREHDLASREEWLNALTEDGVLADVIHVHSIPAPSARTHLSERLARIRETKDIPEENFSMCFDRIRPCPFRACCPRGLEPSAETGFVPTSSIR